MAIIVGGAMACLVAACITVCLVIRWLDADDDDLTDGMDLDA